MDPNACLQRLGKPNRITEDCTEAAADLAKWLHNGGFAPTWAISPRGEKRFRNWYPNIASGK